MGWAQRHNARMREEEVPMFAPVIALNAEGEGIVYVSVPSIIMLSRHEDLDKETRGVGPDGNPWPTTVIQFKDGSALRVKGVPEMLLRSWFGSPKNDAGKIVVPSIDIPGMRRM